MTDIAHAGRAADAARLEDARRYYDGPDGVVRALDGASIAIRSGRFTSVVGPSGSGKSTLVRCLAGLERLTSGKVFLGETELGELDDESLTRLRRDRVSVIFQSFNLIPQLDVAGNITFPNVISGKPVDQAWYLEVVSALGLSDRLGHLPSQLSGGQQQRAAAARALLLRPDLILADEPTGNLDKRSSDELISLLRSAVDEMGQTVLMVTHNASAAAASDRAIFLVDGRVVEDIEHPSLHAVLALQERTSA